MANYSASADHYAWGDGNAFPPWNPPEEPDFSLRAPDATAQAWAWFAGATAVLAATSITSATLTISGIGSPSTGSSEATVHGGESEDEHLPLDHDEAIGRTLTTASASESLDGQTSVAIDITALINELRAAINGDVIQIRITHPTNDEAGLDGLTLSLAIEYVPGDVVIPPEQSGAIPVAIAQASPPDPVQSGRIPTASALNDNLPEQVGSIPAAITQASPPNPLQSALIPSALFSPSPAHPLQSGSIPTASAAADPPPDNFGLYPVAIAQASPPAPVQWGSIPSPSAHTSHPNTGAAHSRRCYVTLTHHAATITAARR